MLSILKVLWGETAGKLVLAIAIGLFVAGVGLSYSKGSSSGHAAGFTDGQKSRDAEVAELNLKVTTLTGIINTKRDAESAKIDKVEVEASDAAINTQKELAQEIRERDRIIERYQSQTPVVVKEACGLSLETVQAINLLIESANDETTPKPDAVSSVVGYGGSDTAVPELSSPLQEGASP